MSSTSGPKKIERDHYLFREGDPPDAMYVVKSGKFAVVKTKQNSEIILAEVGPGAMVGEMAFFDNKPRSASVKAMKDSEVIALPYKALHAQFQNFPEWCKAIMRTVNDHLRNANQRIKQLEKNENSESDLFPPHTITKLVSILNFVGHKYGKQSDEDKGVVINGAMLRNYTIQVFQEATHKMQKLMNVLMEMNLLKVEDIGEGRQKIVIYQSDFLFAFAEWYNEWLFKKETERAVIKEEEIKILKGVLHFAKKQPKNDKGVVKVSLTELQNESMKELGYLIKTEETQPLIEKKLLGEQTMEEGGIISSTLQLDELEKITPFWEIIYALGKVKR
ncbi:MAG: Crp/Fnr family transcriptional regulator [Pseudobdellovibrionaceae bacterium]